MASVCSFVALLFNIMLELAKRKALFRALSRKALSVSMCNFVSLEMHVPFCSYMYVQYAKLQWHLRSVNFDFSIILGGGFTHTPSINEISYQKNPWSLIKSSRLQISSDINRFLIKLCVNTDNQNCGFSINI